MRLLCYLVAVLGCTHAFAETDSALFTAAPPFPPSFNGGAAAQPTPPPITASDNDDNELEALAQDITIIHYAHAIITEYRVNGRLIMVKITPAIGYPYYLVDTDGDGTFDRARYALDETALLNQWRLFSW